MNFFFAVGANPSKSRKLFSCSFMIPTTKSANFDIDDLSTAFEGLLTGFTSEGEGALEFRAAMASI